MSNDLIDHDYDEGSTETQKDQVQRASGLVNTWRFGESGALRESMDDLHLSPYLAPRTSSIWLFLSRILLQ